MRKQKRDMHALLLSAGHLLRDVRHIDNLQWLFGTVVCKIDTRHNMLACNNHIPRYNYYRHRFHY